MNYFWLVSMLAVTTAFLFSPGLWPQISIFLLVATSIYSRIKPAKKAATA